VAKFDAGFETYSTEVRPTEVGMDVRVVVTPLVPGNEPPFQAERDDLGPPWCPSLNRADRRDGLSLHGQNSRGGLANY
jgi:hypothetical protein